MAEITTLSPQLAEEVARLVRGHLRGESDHTDPFHYRQHGDPRKLYRAKVTTEITAAVDLVVGNGIVELLMRQGNNDTLTDQVRNVKVYNALTRVFAVDSYVFVSQDSYGDFYVIDGISAGNTIIFEIIGPSGAQEAESNDCADKLEDAELSYTAKVLWRPCGKKKVPEEDDDGNVVVHDELGSFLLGREESEVDGKKGVAVYLEEDETEAGGASYVDCKWVITFIDWWREVQMISDVIHSADEIRFKVKTVKVWADCDLPDIVIPLVDCEDAS